MRARGPALVLILLACMAAPADSALRLPPLVPQAVAETPTDVQSAEGLVYICPMDPDIRSHDAGRCRRCGMALVAGVPEPVEFHVDASTFPGAPHAGQQSVLQFAVHDPWKDRLVTGFNLVHEKLFHAFVVSQDLQFFEHGHPLLVGTGVFQYPIRFPRGGMYRVLGDFYPSGSTPQLASDTVFVDGEPPAPPALTRDYSTKTTANLRVALTTVPERPVATLRTQMRFVVEGGHGLERYLGAWGHMLVASSDLIDMMHEHPFLADGGPRVEFEVVFPRPGIYRLWVQFQSNGTVNTAQFDIPVDTLSDATPPELAITPGTLSPAP